MYCRAVGRYRTDSTGQPGPPGYGPNCSAKDGIGNWTVHSVIPPDESAGVTNDSVYTNAAAAQTLGWCIEAADLLGIPLSALPPIWSEIASAPYVPLSEDLYAIGTVHPEHANYSGQRINQADGLCGTLVLSIGLYFISICTSGAVALLQYPLGLDFGAAQNQRDLDYYATVSV